MLVGGIAAGIMAVSTVIPTFAAGGFDQYGYNDTARIFNGTCLSWGMGKYNWSQAQAEAYCGDYSNDKLVMKWNDEWDRGNAEGWTDINGYDAWTDNEWNGKKNGSGEVWHYKIKWIGNCVEGEVQEDGGYCIWGQFEVVMDHGTSDGVHTWLAKATPNGYGAN